MSQQVAVAAPSTASTSITLPVHISLESLKQKIASDSSLSYVNLDRAERTCIKESWLSISCVITGYAKRVGEMRLTGAGNQIELSFPVQTQITAKTTSGVRSSATVNGELDLRLAAQISLQPDWQPKLDLSVEYDWNKPPTLKLLNMIKVPLRAYVDPKLDKKISELQASAPALAAKVDLRSKAQSAWNDLQHTKVLEGDTPLYFRFNPVQAFFSGIEVVDGTLNAALTLQGSPVLSTEKPKSTALLPLPKLQQSSAAHAGFNISSAIRLDFLTLNKELDQFERTHKLHDNTVVDVEQLQLTENDNRLAITVSANVDKRSAWLRRIDIFSWFVQGGTFEILVSPRFESQNHRLVLEQSSVKLLSGDVKTTLFAEQVVSQLQNQLNDNLYYHYGDSLDELKSRLNKQFQSLARVGDYRLTGELNDVSIAALSVDERGLSFELLLMGELALSM